jgi:hypothetical protein
VSKRLVWVVLLLGVFAAPLISQDIRLLRVQSVYILPNGDEKETEQFIEKIPKELGWQITFDRSKADIVLVYRIERVVYGATTQGGVYGTPNNKNVYANTYPLAVLSKFVEIYSNDPTPELLWQTSKMGLPKIARTAVERLKKQLRKLKDGNS